MPGRPNKKSGRFSINKFHYDSSSDSYICPHGKKITCNRKHVHNNAFTYHAKKKDCSSCPSREKCLSPKVSCKHIFRNEHQDYKDIALAHLSTPLARQTMKQRKVFAEWVNAESKTRHGLRRAMFRGLNNVAIQVLLTASVQNIKRLMSKLCPPRKIANSMYELLPKSIANLCLNFLMPQFS